MNEYLSKIINHPLRVPVGVGILSFGIGGGLGYILGRRSQPQVEQELPSQMSFNFIDGSESVQSLVKEIEDVVIPIRKIDPHPSEIEKGAKFVEEKITEIVTKEVEAVIEEPVIEQNIFANDNDEWDYEEELKHRTPDAPYILHRDEFFADEMNLTQTTLTYYAGDNIMADQEEVPVYNYANVVGELRFGHGSGDPNVFYVRNEKNRAEYEILFDKGLFSVEVMGLEIENNARVNDLKHSGIRRFKME